MGMVPTVGIFDLLVGAGLAPDEAYRQLGLHPQSAGYPVDYPTLSTADAQAMLEDILGRVRPAR
jgi:hypothetical protein